MLSILRDFDFINSKVLSFSIDGLKTKEKLKRPVLITLQHNQVQFQPTSSLTSATDCAVVIVLSKF